MQAGYQYDVNIVKGDSKEFSWQAMLDYFKESWTVFFGIHVLSLGVTF